MITHSIWRYRGEQDIVNVGTTPVLSLLDEDVTVASINAVALSAESGDSEESGDISGEEVVYVQPRAQSGKSVVNGDAQKLHTKGTNYYAKTDEKGVQFGFGGDDGKEAPFAYLTGTASSGFELSAYGPYRLSVGGDGFAIVNGRSQAQFSVPGAGDGEALRILTTAGGVNTAFIISTGVSINISPGVFYIDCGKRDKLLSLTVKDGELYFQGKKVLTE